jgi:hypothetical protein
MAKTKLCVGLLTAIAAGVLMASQRSHAAEPIPVTSEMMQVVRDEHDLVTDMVREQLAKERDRYKEPRTTLGTSPDLVRMDSQRARVNHSSMRGRGNS